MARPSKFSPERAERILAALAAGNIRRAAAASAGADEGTLGRWMRRFAGFAGAVRAREAEAELVNVAVLQGAARASDWRAALAWLERPRSAEWGRVDRVEIVPPRPRAGA